MAQDQEKADSVYDFLYVDTRRIAQFSSQFNQYGHLTNLTRSVNETSSASGSLGVSASKIDKSSSEQIGQVRQFDPQWLNPLSFLDEANRRKMIRRDIRDAHMGQFVLGTGQMTLIDPGMLRTAWDKPVIQKLIRSGMTGDMAPDQRPRNQRRREPLSATDTKTNEFELLMAILGMIPHAFQMKLVNDDYIIWSTLDDQFVVGRTSDLIIKHGCLLSGDWNVLGIMDAHPYDPEYKNDQGQTEIDLVANTAGTIVGTMAANIGIVARNMVGRPGLSYGVTPLLIFREVSG